MARYPHLGAGNQPFPHLGNARPFERVTDFDYSRYDYEASIRLCRVPWDSSYRDVVRWHDAAERDSWFDSNASEPLELSSGVLRTQTDRVTVAVPYDVALTYNYAYLRVPRMTPDDAIEYETDSGVRTVCAFVTGCTYLSPNATELDLQVDVWSTYLPYLHVDALYLERGHAPMYATTADAYLSDPINRCSDLLTPDVNYGVANITRGTSYQPLSTAALYMVLACTIPPDELDGITRASAQASTPATYYDIAGARDGHQVGVSGYLWGAGQSYAGMISPAHATRASGSLATGLAYYAISGADVSAGALDDVFRLLPVLATSCQAAYVVPGDLVTLGAAHAVGTWQLRECETRDGWQAVGSMQITKQMFGYPARYADIAKLYTAPYAVVELSDDAGNMVQIHVEDTHGSLQAVQRLCAAWPFLAWDVTLSNVESTGSTATYTWRELDGTTTQASAYATDFAQLVLDYDIPTYVLYLDGATTARLSGWYDGMQQRESAIAAYQSTMRSANTGMENALASNATAETNALASNATAESNALASNATAESNALASNATAEANALASNATAKTNADASADTAKTNADNGAANTRAQAVVSNSERDDIRTQINTVRGSSGGAGAPGSGLIGDTVQAIFDNAYADEEYAMFATDANLKSDALASIAHMIPSAIVGDVLGVASAGVSGVINLTTQAALAQLSFTNIQDHEAISMTHTATQLVGQKNLETSLDTIRDGADTTRANNNATLTETNATNSNTTAKANATRSRTTGDANATRSRTTGDANATRSRTTGDANATYTRATAETNAKQALELARQGFEARVASGSVSAPSQHGAYSGTGEHESMRNRGVHMRVKTQPAGAIARAGDAMLRYGYAYDGLWTVTDWCPTGHDMCHWRSQDVILRADDLTNDECASTFRAMLARGVNVWDTPTVVGRYTA